MTEWLLKWQLDINLHDQRAFTCFMAIESVWKLESLVMYDFSLKTKSIEAPFLLQLDESTSHWDLIILADINEISFSYERAKILQLKNYSSLWYIFHQSFGILYLSFIIIAGVIFTILIIIAACILVHIWNEDIRNSKLEYEISPP